MQLKSIKRFLIYDLWRIRTDLIKIYKIINIYSDVRPDVLNVINSKYNLFSKFNFISSNNNDLCKVFQSSFPERVKSYWNVLPIKIKKSKSILEFKKNLESYKTKKLLLECFNYVVTKAGE